MSVASYSIGRVAHEHLRAKPLARGWYAHRNTSSPMLARFGVLIAVIGCTPAPRPTPPPQSSSSELWFAIEEGPAVAAPAPPAPVTPQLDQPAHVKLKLGHYTSARGIGVTIDLTEQTENVADIDPAKLQFDGEPTIWRLEGRYGGRDHTDYVRGDGRIVLTVWDDGRMAVYVPDPDPDNPSTGPIHVYRDGDAEPL